MKIVQEYKQLSENIRIAQIRFNNYKDEITSHQEIYDLNDENALSACITKFDKVRLPNGQINDEGGYTVHCEHLADGKTFCDNWENCDFAKQFDRYAYVKLKEELDDAITARRAFVRNLFKFNKRAK